MAKTSVTWTSRPRSPGARPTRANWHRPGPPASQSWSDANRDQWRGTGPDTRPPPVGKRLNQPQQWGDSHVQTSTLQGPPPRESTRPRKPKGKRSNRGNNSVLYRHYPILTGSGSEGHDEHDSEMDQYQPTVRVHKDSTDTSATGTSFSVATSSHHATPTPPADSHAGHETTGFETRNA